MCICSLVGLVLVLHYTHTMIVQAPEGQYEVELRSGTEVETRLLTLSQVTETVRDYYHKSFNM